VRVSEFSYYLLTHSLVWTWRQEDSALASAFVSRLLNKDVSETYGKPVCHIRQSEVTNILWPIVIHSRRSEMELGRLGLLLIDARAYIGLGCHKIDIVSDACVHSLLRATVQPPHTLSEL